MSQELKPCPFCGGKPGTLARPDNIDGAEFYAAVFCHCESYSATAHAGRRGKTQDEATSAAHAAWNRRAAIAAPPVGWVLVPVEPTLAMGWAYLDAANENEPLRRHSFNWAGYRAMLAAAPGAPDAQPAPARVPLTDEQINEIAERAGHDRFTFAAAIEAAHGITPAKEAP